MKKPARLVILSVFVLAAMAFSAIGAMAMAPTSGTVTFSTSSTPDPKNEVVGVISAMDATSITINGTVYNLSTTSQIQGTIQVGDTVKLEFVTNPDGSLTVYEVGKPESSGSSIEPTGTEPTSTVEPTSTETISPDQNPSKDSSIDPTGTESVSTETVSPDKNSSGQQNGSSFDKSGKNSSPANGSNVGNDSQNNSFHDSSNNTSGSDTNHSSGDSFGHASGWDTGSQNSHPDSSGN